MDIRAAIFVVVCGCGGSQNKVMADTPVLPYQAPDISEITGIEEPDESEPEAAPPAHPAAEAHPTAPAKTPAAAPTPPAPAKAPAAATPAAKTPAAKTPAPGAKTPAPAKAAGSAAPPK